MRHLRIALLFALITSAFLVASQDNDDVVLLPTTYISEVAWSPDGTKLAVIVWRDIQIWDANSWELLVTISDASVDPIAWHPNSQLIAGTGGGTSERLLIWDANTGEMVREWIRSDPRAAPDSLWSQPIAIAWHPDGDIIATSAFLPMDEILFWDVSDESDYDNPIVVKTASETRHNSYDLEWNQSGDLLFSSGSDDLPPESQYFTIRTNYVLDTDTTETALSILDGVIRTWGPDNTLIGTRRVDGEIQIVIREVETGDVLNHFNKHAASITSIAYNAHSSVVASTDIDGTLLIWDFASGNNYEIEPVESTFLREVAWKPNSNTLAIVGEDGVVIRHYDFSN
jgi:WD40 repeat protein